MVNNNLTIIKIMILLVIIGFMYCTHKCLELILIHFALPKMKKTMIVRLYLLNLVLMIFRGESLTTDQIFQQVYCYNEESQWFLIGDVVWEILKDGLFWGHLIYNYTRKESKLHTLLNWWWRYNYAFFLSYIFYS